MAAGHGNDTVVVVYVGVCVARQWYDVVVYVGVLCGVYVLPCMASGDGGLGMCWN